MTEEEELHSKLLAKIESWVNDPSFKIGSTNKQKLERSASLLAGTDPNVLVDVLGITSVPDSPKAAMNLIRNADLSTLKNLQIFTLKGQQRKLVGHHEIPANILGVHIRKMSPQNRYEVFKGLYDMGLKYGMDPSQIQLLPAMVHFNVAHGGDFSGRKTGALLDIIEGERPTQFLKRFQGALDVSLDMAKRARENPLSQDWYAAARGAEQALGGYGFDLASGTTPMDVRAAATSALLNLSEKVEGIVLASPGDVSGIAQQVEELTSTELDPKVVQKYQKRVSPFLDLSKGGAARLNFDPEVLGQIVSFPNRLMQQIPAPVRRYVPGGAIVGGAMLYSDIAQAKEGIEGAATATDKGELGTSVMEATAGTTAALSALPGLQPLAIPSMVFGAAAGAMRMRVTRDQERERTQQVMAGEVSRYGPTVTETPTITKPDSDYKRRRRARTGR